MARDISALMMQKLPFSFSPFSRKKIVYLYKLCTHTLDSNTYLVGYYIIMVITSLRWEYTERREGNPSAVATSFGDVYRGSEASELLTD